MQILEIEPLPPGTGDVAPIVAALLDLDHVGAPIGELAHRGRAGPRMGQIKDGKMRQRQGSDAHECVPLGRCGEWRRQLSSLGRAFVKEGG